jgi:hypothetical protein
MPYIGKIPAIGNYQTLDAITASATATYALTKGGVAVFPQTPANCIVSLNGVIQAPFDSYTISGSNIVFASALTGSDSIDFITVLGDVLNVGTVSDNTIGLAKLTATGTKDATTFLRGDNTFASAGGANTPAFEAYTTGIQSLTEETFVKMTMATEVFDTDGDYDNVTNYRFTPQTAGKYFCYAKAQSDPAAYENEKSCAMKFYVNGSAIGYSTSEIMTGGNSSTDGATASTITISNTFILNGTTDYVEVFFQADTWSNSGAQVKSKVFGGYRIIE